MAAGNFLERLGLSDSRLRIFADGAVSGFFPDAVEPGAGDWGDSGKKSLCGRSSEDCLHLEVPSTLSEFGSEESSENE